MITEVREDMTTVRRRVTGKVSRMTVAKADELLLSILNRRGTIDQPVIRDLTGGYNSQSINTYVVRNLAVRAKKAQP